MGAQLVRPRRGSPRARTRSSLPLGTFLAFVLLSIMLYSVALPVNDSGPPSLLHRRIADKVQSAFASLSGGTEKISRELLGTAEGEEIAEQGGEENAFDEEVLQIDGEERASAQVTIKDEEEKNVSAIAGPRNTSHDTRLVINQNVPQSVQEVAGQQAMHTPTFEEEGETQRKPLAEDSTAEADCSKQSVTEEEPDYMANITNYDMLWKQGMWWVPEHPRPTLTIGVLVYKEKESLQAAFETWRKAGLLEYADEVVVYYQLLDDDKLHWLDDFAPLCRGPLRVIGSPNNEALLAATQWVIGNATMDLVLFLEKDWQILETPEATLQRLDDGKMLLEYDIAHVVRYRHRTNPGNPLYCQEIYQGREMEILNNQPNLMCCVHHWLPNAELASPKYQPYVYKCPALPKLNGDKHVIFERNQNDWWCSRAEHCLWTNNPYLLRREWWDRHYKPMVDALIDQWDGWTEHQRALDIEYLFGWNPAFWNAKAWTIAVGEGLFTHVERAEHVEVDYKQLRAEADERDRERDRKLAEQKAEAEGKENERLRIEAETRDQQKQALVNTQTATETETRAAETEVRAAEARQKLRGEVFGRKVGGEEGMESAEEEADPEAEAAEGMGVGDSLLLEKPTSKLDDSEETDVPIHLRTDLPIWELHTQPSEEWVQRGRRILDQCTLDDPDGATSASENPNPAVKGDITLVTALLDLGRGGETNGMFKRGMDEYFARFQRILDRGFPMVVYMPAEFREHLRIDEARVQVRELTVDGLKDEALFGPYWNAVQLIRTSDLWQRQAAVTGWLDKAPQAVLLGYNPLVMSKPFLLQKAAHENPFGTKYFMFLDAGHACATEITPGQTSLFEEHMDRLFATYWRYASTTEVHGLTDKAMHLYMGQPEDPLKIVRGGILGGRTAVIDCLVDVYRVVLAQTLEDGYMGTEENLLAILYARFPELFHAFDNDSRGTPCDNCAAFSANLERYKATAQ